jgi:hypothetical protein
MGLEVLSQIVDPLGQDRNLHFRRACIHLVGLKRGDNLSFPFFRQHDSSISLTLLGSRIIQCCIHFLQDQYDNIRALCRR